MRFTTAILFSLATVAGPAPPSPPQPPFQAGQPRDTVRRPEPTGTGVVRGRVVAADTGSAIRRANVSLIPTAAAPLGTPTTALMNGAPVQMGSVSGIRPRTATTDSQGAFEFTGLPAGTYRLTASANQYYAAYLGMTYGAKRPNGPGIQDFGQSIELANGQVFDKAIISLPRGGVITGRVTDENGDALARVQVYTLLYPPGGLRGQRTGAGAQTDDLGQFRLFGLIPGDYAIVAEARGPTYVPPNATPETDEEKIGFVTTYYPGTADEGAAQHVRTRTGGETAGIEMRMASGRLFRISGAIIDSQGRPSIRTNGTLMRRQLNTMNNFGFSTDEQGRFQMRNIPPGNYRLLVRPMNMPNSDSSRPVNEPPEMANLPLTVNADLENISVITSPGTTITGQIVFEQGPPLPVPQQMRVSAQVVDPEGTMYINNPQSAVVTPDLTFTIKGMMGEFVLRAGAQGQYLKAVMMGAEDITDTPREFKNGDKVTLVLTQHASTLEGTVTDTEGKPTTDASVIFFSEDKASWRVNSSKMRRSGVDPTGRYKLTGLMPGRYFIAAVPRERMNGLTPGTDAAFFEQMSKDSTAVVVGEDEQRQVDLKVTVIGGGA